MVRDRLLSITGGLFLMLLCAGQASATEYACASAEGTWTDFTGTWSLTQHGDGTVTGTLTNVGSSGCPANNVWAVTGRMGADGGDFRYTAVFNPLVHRPETCAKTIIMDGTITKPGCNNANGTWTNSSNRSGVFAMNTSCRIPPSEGTPQFVQWGGDGIDDTVAGYNQNLLPTSFNYGGRSVQESFQADAIDTCYFVGSTHAKIVTMPAKPRLSVASRTPSFYGDYVGLTAETVNYYRRNNVSPCGIYLKQRMKIDCDTNEPVYQVNDLELSQGPFHVASGRGPTKVSKPWGAPPPARVVIPIIINLILEQ